MKLGLLFGSFDPIHNGHLSVVAQAFDQGVDEVWLIVQPLNVYKALDMEADFSHRVAMAKLATDSLARVSAYELDPQIMAAHSMADTLQELKKADNERQLVLLLGQDLADDLPTWNDYDQIRALASIYEYDRQAHDASSSQVRELVRADQPISDLVPQAVAEYIFEHNLYA